MIAMGLSSRKVAVYRLTVQTRQLQALHLKLNSDVFWTIVGLGCKQEWVKFFLAPSKRNL